MNHKAGQSPKLCAIRGNVDDQTLSLPISLEPLARDLLKSVFRPSGTQFRDDKQKQWDRAMDPEGGMIIAGLPLWNPVDKYSTLPSEETSAATSGELWIGIGNHEFLRKNCVDPALVSLATALSALRVIWDHRPGGRPALQLIIRFLRLCVCQRFVHFARWFPPAITKYALDEIRRQIVAFFFQILGWEAHFVSNEHREYVASQILLPGKAFGGLGFGMVASNDAAFLASWFSPLDTIAKNRGISVDDILLEWDTAVATPNPPVFVRGLRESMLRLPKPEGSFSALWKSFFKKAERSSDSGGKGCGTKRTESGRPRWQYFMAHGAWRQMFEQLSVAFLPAALQKRDLRRLTARCLPHAGRAMRVLPSNRSLQLEEQEVRDWLAWSYGVPLDPIEWWNSKQKTHIVAQKCVIQKGQQHSPEWSNRAKPPACDAGMFFFLRSCTFV